MAETPPGAMLDLEHFLPYRLSVLSNSVSQAIAATYSERFELSVTQWRVIAVLGRYHNLSAGEVAERTKMDKVAVSRAVTELVRAGRLDRSLHDEDRRRSVLRLSDAGQRVYADIAPFALDCEARLKSVLSDAENVQLECILDKLSTIGVAKLMARIDQANA